MQIALTIAGSDSGGGAGIQADLRTFQSFGVFGTTVLTAVTAQNTRGVRAVHPVPPEHIAAQLAAVMEELPPAACKSGMLGTAAAVRVVAQGLARYNLANYVLDPVRVATSGDRLLAAEAERLVLEQLVPRATLVTPNLAEAAALTGLTVDDPDSMARAGARLLEAGAPAVLVKGGHLPGDALIDLLVTRDGIREFPARRIPTRATHGTGCTLSAAITAGLALGRALEDAVADAIDHVRLVIGKR